MNSLIIRKPAKTDPYWLLIYIGLSGILIGKSISRSHVIFSVFNGIVIIYNLVFKRLWSPISNERACRWFTTLTFLGRLRLCTSCNHFLCHNLNLHIVYGVSWIIGIASLSAAEYYKMWCDRIKNWFRDATIPLPGIESTVTQLWLVLSYASVSGFVEDSTRSRIFARLSAIMYNGSQNSSIEGYRQWDTEYSVK